MHVAELYLPEQCYNEESDNDSIDEENNRQPRPMHVYTPEAEPSRGAVCSNNVDTDNISVRFIVSSV